jgi:hypothetical protein
MGETNRELLVVLSQEHSIACSFRGLLISGKHKPEANQTHYFILAAVFSRENANNTATGTKTLLSSHLPAVIEVSPLAKLTLVTVTSKFPHITY